MKTLNKKLKRMTEKEKSEIKRRLLSGESCRPIAESIKRNVSQVYNVRRHLTDDQLAEMQKIRKVRVQGIKHDICEQNKKIIVMLLAICKKLEIKAEVD